MARYFLGSNEQPLQFITAVKGTFFLFFIMRYTCSYSFKSNSFVRLVNKTDLKNLIVIHDNLFR